MDYKSLLNDAQAAELLGIKLNGKSLEDLPVLTRVHEFKDTFLTSLEEELAKAEREEMLKVAKKVFLNSLTGAIKETSSRTPLYTNPNQFYMVDDEIGQDGNLQLTAQVLMYTGNRYRAPNNRRDAKVVKDLLERVKHGGFDSIDGLGFAREGYAKIETLGTQAMLPIGKSTLASHLVTARYTTSFPEETLSTIYALHGPQAKG